MIRSNTQRVIFKWKAGLKDDIDAWSHVYVLSNGCKKCSDDSDVYYWEYTLEKNGKWSCIYAVGSQEYQMVCTRPDIESADVGMLDGKLRSYDAVHDGFVTTKAAYMTLTEAAKEAIWLKGVAIKSGFELKIVAGIATGVLSKAIPGPSFLFLLFDHQGFGVAPVDCLQGSFFRVSIFKFVVEVYPTSGIRARLRSWDL
ncbi:hypothetical protein Tco_0089026 [Tanacetum coccineum]